MSRYLRMSLSQSRQTETNHAAAAAGLDPDTEPDSSPVRSGPGRAGPIRVRIRRVGPGGSRADLRVGTAVQGMLTVTLTKPRPVLIH